MFVYGEKGIRWGLFKIGGNTFVGHLEWGPLVKREQLYNMMSYVYRLNLSIIQ